MDLLQVALQGRRNFGQGGLVLPGGNQGIQLDPFATGDFIANVGRDTYNYLTNQGDYAPIQHRDQQVPPNRIADNPPAKRLKESVNDDWDDYYEDNNMTSAPENMQIEAPTQFSAGGNSTGSGTKGALIGRTATKRNREEYFHERQIAHSKKERIWTHLWSYSRWDQPTTTGMNQRIYMEKWGDYGLTYFPSKYYDDLNYTQIHAYQPYMGATIAGTPDQGTGHEKNLTDMIMCQAINLYIEDFIDSKLYNFTNSTGIFLNYNKLLLKNFTITITPKTYNGNILTMAPWIVRKTEADNVKQDSAQLFHAENYENNDHIQELDIDYWIYRDIYGIWNEQYGIPNKPPDMSAATAPKVPRTVRTLRAIDNNKEIMSNKKSFSYTREVKSTGSYFINPSDLPSIKNQCIHHLVNELEGQVGTLSYSRKFPEYLNLCYGPINAPSILKHNMVVKANVDGSNKQYGDIPFVGCYTILNVKYQAQWECFDYKHISYGVPASTLFTTESEKTLTPYTDPLIIAERNLVAATELQNMQINRGL